MKSVQGPVPPLPEQVLSSAPKLKAAGTDTSINLHKPTIYQVKWDIGVLGPQNASPSRRGGSF